MPPADGTDSLTRRYRVEGKVQGVFFRASTRDVASGLGMSGHALNLDNGSVEVVAAGSPEAHRKLERWLRDGPPAARVKSVDSDTLDAPPPEGFTIG